MPFHFSKTSFGLPALVQKIKANKYGIPPRQDIIKDLERAKSEHYFPAKDPSV